MRRLIKQIRNKKKYIFVRKFYENVEWYHLLCPNVYSLLGIALKAVYIIRNVIELKKKLPP